MTYYVVIFDQQIVSWCDSREEAEEFIGEVCDAAVELQRFEEKSYGFTKDKYQIAILNFI